jgi:hypothetical protein
MLWDVVDPHCLDNRFTEGAEVVSLKRRPSARSSGSHFYLRLSKVQCQNAVGRIR